MMRLLTPLLVSLAVVGCTRENPTFGAGDTDGETGRETGDPSGDPSGNPSSDSLSSTGNVDSGTSGITTSASTDPTATDDSATAVDTLEPPRDCCETHDAPGCDNPDIETCVCAELGACCSLAWTDKCVEKASTHCEAGCAVSSLSDSLSDSLSGGSGETTSTTDGTVSDGATTSDGGGSTTMGISPCCDISAVGGCNADADVEACVCEIDNGCCGEAWAQSCIDLAMESCNLVCG